MITRLGLQLNKKAIIIQNDDKTGVATEEKGKVDKKRNSSDVSISCILINARSLTNKMVYLLTVV